MKNKNYDSNIFTASESLDKEFYKIPLFGEVHIDSKERFKGDYDLGEIITNFRNDDRRSINVRAADNALSGAGIFKGDFLTVNLDIPIKDGEIAVVKLGSKIYIRKIYFDKNRVRLETETNTPSPLIINMDTPGFEIIGKIITVFREL